MTAGQKIAYGNDPRQYIDLHSSKTVRDGKSSALIIFIHGGGWYSGSTKDHEDLAQYVSTNSDATVALIEYSLTLKDKPEENTICHPDHINDVHSALRLLFDSSIEQKYKYIASKAILVGHSAGGWMVLSAALDRETDHLHGLFANIPPLGSSIRENIRAFVAVESIFSLVGLLKMYPSYMSFIIPAFCPPGTKEEPPYCLLERVGVEAWQVASDFKQKVYVIHSSEDDLLSADYNAQGIELLRQKGLDPIVDVTSFKGKHDDLLHTEAFWTRLIEIQQAST